MVRAFREQDLSALGEVSTRSATLNQQRCPKRFYAAVLELCQKVGGLGVVVTHSGPCIGILLAQIGEQHVFARAHPSRGLR